MEGAADGWSGVERRGHWQLALGYCNVRARCDPGKTCAEYQLVRPYWLFSQNRRPELRSPPRRFPDHYRRWSPAHSVSLCRQRKRYFAFAGKKEHRSSGWPAPLAWGFSPFPTELLLRGRVSSLSFRADICLAVCLMKRRLGHMLPARNRPLACINPVSFAAHVELPGKGFTAIATGMSLKSEVATKSAGPSGKLWVDSSSSDLATLTLAPLPAFLIVRTSPPSKRHNKMQRLAQ
jgi:hypothetical protein